MYRNTSISLGDHFDEFIQTKVTSGRYKNASEVVRAGLRLLEEEENKIVALRTAIEQGLESGIAEEINPEELLSKIKAKKRMNGQV